jgi:hypothetical protein
MKKLFFLLVFLSAGCQSNPPVAEAPSTSVPNTPTTVPTPTPVPMGAGFRYSTYGPWRDPGPEYWGSVGEQMAGRFPDAVPETVWIVGNQGGKGTVLSFPGTTEEPYIFFSSKDNNEESLSLFDELGFKVWLQVEPGEADVVELIHLILNQYGRHPSVVGVGVDVEWYGSIGSPEGIAVSDEVAATWLAATQEHNEDYRLFLKHWLPEKMPPTMRDGLLFVDDTQGFDSKEAMVAEFSAWGETFAPAPVAFQIGYGSDKIWWQEFEDPPGEIGQDLLTAVPNLEALYWVDFTVLDVFPPVN